MPKFAKVKCPDCMSTDTEAVPDHYTLRKIFGETVLFDGKSDIRFICDVCGQQMDTLELREAV